MSRDITYLPTSTGSSANECVVATSICMGTQLCMLNARREMRKVFLTIRTAAKPVLLRLT